MNILYVLHSGLTGGTFYTTLDLIKNINQNHDIFLLGAEESHLILYNYVNGELNIIKEFKRDGVWSVKKFHDSWLTYVYFEILMDYNINLIHIMHLILHSFDLPYVAKKLGIKTVLSFHDFYFICPNYVLINENGKYCDAICSQNKKNCKLEWNIFDDINFKEILPIWRNEVENLFNNIDIFISTSDFVKNLYLSTYPNKDVINSSNFIILEHGQDFVTKMEDLFEIPSDDKPLKIVCPSNHINTIKGLGIIKCLKELDKDNELEFHFLGNAPDFLKEYGVIHGTYERDKFYKMIEKINPSFVGIFSIWPETFCYTISEAWSCNIPVIGTNIGVIQERIKNNDGGLIIDRYNLKESYEKIINLKKLSKNDYLHMISDISKIELKTTKQMSDEYTKIYYDLINSD